MTDKILDELARKVCAETAELVCYYDANYPGWRTTVPDTGLGLKWSAVLKALDAYWAKTSKETPPPPATHGAGIPWIDAQMDRIREAYRVRDELEKVEACRVRDELEERLAKAQEDLERTRAQHGRDGRDL